MRKEQFIMKLAFILTLEEMARISVKEEKSSLILTIDLHSLKCLEARKILSKIIALNKYAFALHVIHGYNHGTALKEMIRYQYSNERIVNMTSPANNPGITYLQISAQA